MKPVIKWAGGKSQLIKHIRELIPKRYNQYFEPFLGGGAVLLEISPRTSVVNDINPELINMYLQIKYSPDKLIKSLKIIDHNHEESKKPKEYYYYMREKFNNNIGSNTPEQAARLIYINKHCFNGLYRVNSKGLFNVPFNNKIKGESFTEENIYSVSRKFQNITIKLGDFEDAIDTAQKGDFIFFDSPYVPINETSFTDYTKEGFDFKDHVRLANVYKYLSQNGIYCMLTNHNTRLVRELYSEYNIKYVQVSRNINSRASERRGEEVIITNYAV